MKLPDIYVIPNPQLFEYYTLKCIHFGYKINELKNLYKRLSSPQLFSSLLPVYSLVFKNKTTY